MARFFNLESAVVLLVLLAVLIGGCFAVGLAGSKAVALGVAISLFAFFPLAALIQDKLVEIYAQHGKLDRALLLAVTVRDSAPTTKLKNRARVDVALLQLVRRDYERALANLRQVKLALITNEVARAVVQGHHAYCLAHLGRDLDRAEELARTAFKAVPDEPIFGYFLGLVLLQEGNAAEAEPLIATSLEKNPDPTEPFPGERAWALARAQAEVGKDFEAAKGQAIAAGGYFAEQAQRIGMKAPAAG